MTSLMGIILFLGGFIIGGLIIWFIRQKEIDLAQSSKDQLKAEFGDLSRQALEQNMETFYKVATQKFGDILKSSESTMDEKKKLIDASLEGMSKNLEGLSKSTFELKGQMEESKKGIDQLSDKTSKLSRILDSSQARGQWGERMVKDKRLNMDVKFPWDHYAKLFSTDDEDDNGIERKSFLKDVKGHVKTLSKRDYIDPADGTLDFVLMFIPNEGIYAFLNKPKTGEDNLVEFAMENKVLLCSPITLFAILAMVRQSVQSFHLESKAIEVQDLVQSFKAQWNKFFETMNALGKSLGTVNTHYKNLSTTRATALKKPMDDINKLQLGQKTDKKEIE